MLLKCSLLGLSEDQTNMRTWLRGLKLVPVLPVVRYQAFGNPSNKACNFSDACKINRVSQRQSANLAGICKLAPFLGCIPDSLPGSQVVPVCAVASLWQARFQQCWQCSSSQSRNVCILQKHHPTVEIYIQKRLGTIKMCFYIVEMF